MPQNGTETLPGSPRSPRGTFGPTPLFSLDKRTLREGLVGLAAEEASTPLVDVIEGPTDAAREETRRVRATQSSVLPAR